MEAEINIKSDDEIQLKRSENILRLYIKIKMGNSIDYPPYNTKMVSGLNSLHTLKYKEKNYGFI